MHNDSMELHLSELGKKSDYVSHYNPGLLFPIPRSAKRIELGLDSETPGFYGFDIWTHYEVSWLNPKGKPIVGIANISYPASSKSIIESKSMKLYFNSLNNTKFRDVDELTTILKKDLSQAVQENVDIEIIEVNSCMPAIASINDGVCLDDIDVECDTYQPNSAYLKCGSKSITEKLYSNLLKSNCLVTGQPDWGTVCIEYSGNQIDRDGLLKYIVSLRDHNEFHEQCVERIFTDIKQKCSPDTLTVYARYTRRGGLDINPYRSTNKNYQPLNQRLVRQ